MSTIDDPYAFLLAGGRLSPAEWEQLDEDSRRALADAGAQHRQEALLLIAHAIARPASAVYHLTPAAEQRKMHMRAALNNLGRGQNG